MKFIPILLTVLLICVGAANVSAGGFGGGWGCFDSSCHQSVECDDETWTSHAEVSYPKCMSCHPVLCDGNAARVHEANEVKKQPPAETVSGIKLFTEEDSEWAATTMSGSGFGKMVALVDWAFKMSLIVVPILMVLIWIISNAINKVDTGKWAIKGLFYVIAALMLLKIVMAAISSFSPDLSVVII